MRPRGKLRLLFLYASLLGVPILVLAGILIWGRHLPPPAGDLTNGPHLASFPTSGFSPGRLLLQVVVILAAARLAGAAFRRLGQPAVVGEMAAGILLGPSLMGRLVPAWSAFLFPPDSLVYLNALSQIGLMIFLFVVGLTVNPRELRGYGSAAVLVSNVGIVVPFASAVALSVYLYPRLAEPHVDFLSFALFIGAAMSVTAFPVLARILVERGLLRTRLGALSIACAAVDDVTGWAILAVIVVLLRASHNAPSLWLTLLGPPAFAAFMIFGVRKLVARIEPAYVRHQGVTPDLLAIAFGLLFASSLITEALGIHFLFGAFLAGCIMPKNRALVHELREKLEPVTVTLLLPLFFAYTGLRTDLMPAHGPALWTDALVITAVAIAGKLGGCLAAARAAGMPWRESAALGILMNTRGLMELVVLNIGLEIGVISTRLFSAMVLMAVATTVITTPLLRLLEPPGSGSVASSEPERTAAL
jgi:Kef-type K+ transport system membrane component KefB